MTNRIWLMGITSVLLLAFTGVSEAQEPKASQGSARVAAKGAPASNWEYSENKDQMRGTVKHFAVARSQNTVLLSSLYGEVQGGLALRDEGGELNIMLTIDRGQFLCSRFTRSIVSVKFDDGDIVDFPCIGTDAGNTGTVFIEPEKVFLAKLKNSAQVIIEAPFFQVGRKQMVFRTQGLEWNYNSPGE